ncbi:hypothetical protein ANOM_008592 [Aspergillus nomiae NRRL 13137]|uniref:Uncharacterized protein n=1 Tax=Aspergillus nomiae NRRL (strain ATCC 15546 / NRRL 13137 / CBS 260.88 / M93) TaxID=1509407 RepID=A0A0L1IX80_ASPN3|nr:uncharacterized protein ANOM_008592 [Aspergillus nomiae NRRL 13137]KNG84166.1 hypothetical protein ANOM_008592 [Aspergillus nomiae NRRL 13137]
MDYYTDDFKHGTSFHGRYADFLHLFPGTRQATKEYYLHTKIFQIMHFVVIKKKIVDQYPFVVTPMLNALNDSKDMALRRMQSAGTHRYMLPFLPSQLEEIDDIFGGDPWPYGLEVNRKPLEALVTYLEDQTVISHKVPLEQLFALIYGKNLKR